MEVLCMGEDGFIRSENPYREVHKIVKIIGNNRGTDYLATENTVTRCGKGENQD